MPASIEGSNPTSCGRFGAWGDDVQVLRHEVDRNGDQFVIGCNGIRRSIQLKTTRKNGKAQAVTVNCRLATEPSGCVIWILFDEKTLQLGPFLWLGRGAGVKLQDLGDKPAKHTRGNKGGIKAARPGRRVVARSLFTWLEDMHQLAQNLVRRAFADHERQRRPACYGHRGVSMNRNRAALLDQHSTPEQIGEQEIDRGIGRAPRTCGR